MAINLGLLVRNPVLHPRPGPRVISFESGRPLPRALRSNDSTLVVESGDVAAPFVIVPESNEPALVTAVKRSSYIAVIEVSDVRGHFTPEQDWITSTVTAVVKAALKPNTTLGIAEGNVVTFVDDGGEVYYEGKHIQAVSQWATPVVVGGEYLAFGSRQAKRIAIGAMNSYQITDGRLVSRDRDVIDNGIAGRPSDEVIAVLKQLIAGNPSPLAMNSRLQPSYSFLSATIGSTVIARRAGR